MKSMIFKVTMFSLFAATAMAGASSPSLVCENGAKIYTEIPTVKMHVSLNQGQMVSSGMELGEVTVVNGGSTTVLSKTGDADKTWGGLGKVKGFGYFEAPGIMHLDLRNTVDNYNIFLVDEQTGQQVECKVQGDCC